jgi:hypothetical protein
MIVDKIITARTVTDGAMAQRVRGRRFSLLIKCVEQKIKRRTSHVLVPKMKT